MQVFHIATLPDWQAARRSGSYTTSTYGRSLADEGFIHAARREQVRGVFGRYYRDVPERLVLLTIDTDRLDVPWREDVVGEDTFPHVYGAIPRRAVVSVTPLNRRGGTASFLSLFFEEIMVRALPVVLGLLLAVVGGLLGSGLAGVTGAVLGAVAGLAVGGVILWSVLRHRS